MASNNPNAIAIANIRALIPLTSPFNMLPSIRSVKLFIKGTPGIKKSTDVANACSKFIFNQALINAPANKEATREPKNTQI